MVEKIYNQLQQYEPLKLSNNKHLNIEMTTGTTEAVGNLGMFLLIITFTINIL